MATVKDLRFRLRRAINDRDVEDPEFEDAELDQLITTALKRHDDEKTLSQLPDDDEYPVLLLAWRQVCYIRAGGHTQFFNLSGQEGSGDKSQIMDNNLRMASELKEEYDTAVREETPEVATVVIRNRFRDLLTPDYGVPVPDELVLGSPTNITATTADLQWNRAGISNFRRYVVFRHTSAGLKDLTRLNNDDASDENRQFGVIAAALKVRELYEQHQVDFRDGEDDDVSALVSGTTYYWVVVVEDRNHKISVSNEVSATTL